MLPGAGRHGEGHGSRALECQAAEAPSPEGTDGGRAWGSTGNGPVVLSEEEENIVLIGCEFVIRCTPKLGVGVWDKGGSFRGAAHGRRCPAFGLCLLVPERLCCLRPWTSRRDAGWATG